MGKADFLRLGDWNVACFFCGRKRKASEMWRYWKGFYVCPEEWEPRQPQDFVRGIPDVQAPPWVQPQSDGFVGITATAGLNAGTLPPVPVVVGISGTTTGQITFGTGLVPVPGSMVVVSLGPNIGITPAVHLTALNGVTQALGLTATSVSANGFTATSAVAPAASQPNYIYSFSYTLVY